MGFFNKKDDSYKSDYDLRSHQDNFYGDTEGGYDNNNYQYCRVCGAHRKFEYDRCSKCKSN